ncbi:uncharacterized protein LOC124164939 [Ischnura elegans]|uniref:uncharacterized protein LOC124164939 n=1 Tax=Ischnura elegans TaxID=197161 RepID=UPI001ED89BC6|nr:uncharacterized protein LOC124164939 [Ischnura elegans]
MAVDAVPAVVSTPSVRSRGSIREKKRLVCLWKRLSRTPGTVAAKEMADTDVLSFPCSINNNIINNPTSPYSHSSGHLPPVFVDKGANQESTSACGCSHVSGSLEKQCSKASSSSSSSLARRMPSLLLPVGRGGFWSSTSAPAENFSLGWSARLIQPNEESCCTGEAVTGTRSCSPLPTPPEEDFDATSPSGDFDVCGGKVCGRVVETSSSCSTPMSTITVDRSRGREGPVGSPSGVGGRGGHRVVVDGGADDCHGGDGTGSSCCCSRVADDAGVSGVSESVEVCVEGDLFARSVGGGVELPNDSTMGPQQQQKYHHRNHRQRHRGIPSSRSWYWWTMFLYFSFFMVATVDAQLRPNTHARNTKDDGGLVLCFDTDEFKGMWEYVSAFVFIPSRSNVEAGPTGLVSVKAQRRVELDITRRCDYTRAIGICVVSWTVPAAHRSSWRSTRQWTAARRRVALSSGEVSF